MVDRRPFAPQFVFGTGSWFVAVDRIQPVAVVLAPDGERASVVSWAELVPAPSVSPWPSRRVAATENQVVVQDLPDGPPVTLTIGPDGYARTTTQPPAEGLLRSAGYSRLWTAGPRDRTAAVSPWTFGSTADRLSWTARVGHTGAPDLDLAGSIVDFAASHDTALACVQRVDKRPWPFDRRAEMVLLSVDGSEIATRSVPNPDIDKLCWPSRFSLRSQSAALHDYLLFGLRQIDAASTLGIQDPRIVLSGAMDDPRIEISFRHPDYPGREFRRVDRPFNELGNLGEGLRELHISLSEDIETGVLAHCDSRTNGPVVYC